MRKIKKIGVMSVSKLMGALYAVLGFVEGLFFLLIAVLSHGASTSTPFPFAFAFGFGAPIFLAVFFGVFGFIFGAFSTWLYNVVAKWVGGIEFEVE